jgi:hypothetical protein
VPEAAQPGFFGTVLGEAANIFKPTLGPRGAVHDSMATSMAKSAMRAAGSPLGRQVIRGVLGGILGGASSGRKR